MNSSRLKQRSYLPERVSQRRRVVVTGVGAVSAAGVGVQKLWSALLDARSCISSIENYDSEGMRSRIGGEVKDFDPAKLIEPRLKPKRLARQGQFALVASAEAVANAQLQPTYLREHRCGVVLGSASCNTGEIAAAALRVHEKGPNQLSPATMGIFNMQSQVSAVIDQFELQNVQGLSIAGACTSGIDAIVMGADMIRAGQAEIVICGGTDSPLSRTGGSVLIQAGICSSRNDEPERASRPFDRERDNGLMAEGAAVVVLERRDLVLDRGGDYYAEWLGDHTIRDAQDGLSGNGLGSAMSGALQNALCALGDIDYISAWGCGDPLIDQVETQAIKEVFGERAYDIAVSSIKAVTGNPLAAGGALQMVAGALTLHHRLLPPTANYEHGDLDCDLDYIRGSPRRARPRRILLNAHGQGGGNTCVVLGPRTAE